MPLTLSQKGQTMNPNASITDIKSAYHDRNRELGFGAHWFSKDTMRFFNCHLANHAWKVGNDFIFVSSERFDEESPRLYSVRSYDHETGDIDTVGKFQQYRTREQALAAAAKYAESLKG